MSKEYELQLIEKLRSGDMPAFEEIYLTYYAPLCEYATFYVYEEDAEEIVSEFMLHLWESKGKIIIHSSLKSYLFGAVKFRCYNAIEKQKIRQKVHNKIYEELKDEFDSPEYYMGVDLVEEVYNAINELPESYIETFKESRFGTKTNQQLAIEMNVSIKTIEYRITQSLKILHKKLSNYVTLLFLF